MGIATKEAPKFHTVMQVAERWNTCARTVRRAIEKKELVAHQFGRAVRISDEDLRNYERIRRGN